MPDFSPPPNAITYVLPNNTVDEKELLAFIPGKYLNCKSSTRSLLSGIRIPTRALDGVSIMMRSWKSMGTIGAKLKLFGLTGADGHIPSSAGTVSTAASTASDNISALTGTSGLQSNAGGSGDGNPSSGGN
jgi:hypothetical protein